jgi:hypothetical protein
MNVQATHNSLYVPRKEGNLAGRIADLMLTLMKWEKQINRALKVAQNTYSFDDIAADVMNGKLELWDFGDCFTLTTINMFPQYKTFHFFIAGGNMESMFAKVSFFKEVARERGCAKLTLTGRDGWERAGKAVGWKKTMTLLQMEIDQ